jgi:hypothetical protein
MLPFTSTALCITLMLPLPCTVIWIMLILPLTHSLSHTAISVTLLILLTYPHICMSLILSYSHLCNTNVSDHICTHRHTHTPAHTHTKSLAPPHLYSHLPCTNHPTYAYTHQCNTNAPHIDMISSTSLMLPQVHGNFYNTNAPMFVQSSM